MIDPLEIIQRYYPEGSNVYNILVTHSQCVRDKAMQCIDRHPELQIDRQFVAEAAMLHDIGIFYTYAPPIGCVGPHLYIEHGILGANLLREIGLPRHALVCERHTGTGLSKEYILRTGYPLPVRDMIPETLEEQLICYADKFYSKNRNLTEEKPFDLVRSKLGKFEDESVERFDMMHKLFG